MNRRRWSADESNDSDESDDSGSVREASSSPIYRRRRHHDGTVQDSTPQSKRSDDSVLRWTRFLPQDLIVSLHTSSRRQEDAATVGGGLKSVGRRQRAAGGNRIMHNSFSPDRSGPGAVLQASDEASSPVSFGKTPTFYNLPAAYGICSAAAPLAIVQAACKVANVIVASLSDSESLDADRHVGIRGEAAMG